MNTDVEPTSPSPSMQTVNQQRDCYARNRRDPAGHHYHRAKNPLRCHRGASRRDYGPTI